MRLDGVAALITGGGGLLGAATVADLAAAGARVVVADLAPGRAAGLLGERVRFVRADVTVEAEVLAAVEAAAALAPLRVVVACAGAGLVRRTLDREGTRHDAASFRRTVELNLVGTFLTLTAAAAAMARTEAPADGERGVVVTTASLAGLEGSAGQVAYGAAKAGVAGLTLPAARDLGPVGVRVVCIAPGGMAEPADVDAGDAVAARLLDNVVHPRRFGTPRDFALLVRQVVEHPYLNGCVLRLDGGARLGRLV